MQLLDQTFDTDHGKVYRAAAEWLLCFFMELQHNAEI